MRLSACCIVVLALGCGGGSNDQGGLGGSCYPDDSCDTGFDCIADVCEYAADAAVACGAASEVQFVISELLGGGLREGRELGLDIDGDDRTDNAFGGLLGALANGGSTLFGPIDLLTPTNEQVVTGDFIQLLSIATEDLNSTGCASIRTYQGDTPSPTPCTTPGDVSTCSQHLQGTGSFSIAPSTPSASAIEGTLSEGVFTTATTGDPATAFVAFSMTAGAPIAVKLFGAKIAFDVSSGALTTGRIGGGISISEIDAVVLPAFRGAMQAKITADCSPAGKKCSCEVNSEGQSVVRFLELEASADCQLPPLEQFAAIRIIDVLFRNPDIDLLDANGMPGTDGVADHLSVGFGFSATAATF